MMNLKQEELEVLSDCILSKMEQLSKIIIASEQLMNSIRKEVQMLERLNSKVCNELQYTKEQSSNT